MKTDIQSNDSKRYYRNEFGKGYYSELRCKILPLIQQAVPIAKIKKDFLLQRNQIGFLIQYKDKKPTFTKILGCKEESYYSEDEMMKTISYTYNDLSPDEKLIYNTIP